MCVRALALYAVVQATMPLAPHVPTQVVLPLDKKRADPEHTTLVEVTNGVTDGVTDGVTNGVTNAGDQRNHELTGSPIRQWPSYLLSSDPMPLQFCNMLSGICV